MRLWKEQQSEPIRLDTILVVSLTLNGLMRCESTRVTSRIYFFLFTVQSADGGGKVTVEAELYHRFTTFGEERLA